MNSKCAATGYRRCSTHNIGSPLDLVVVHCMYSKTSGSGVTPPHPPSTEDAGFSSKYIMLLERGFPSWYLVFKFVHSKNVFFLNSIFSLPQCSKVRVRRALYLNIKVTSQRLVSATRVRPDLRLSKSGIFRWRVFPL